MLLFLLPLLFSPPSYLRVRSNPHFVVPRHRPSCRRAKVTKVKIGLPISRPDAVLYVAVRPQPHRVRDREANRNGLALVAGDGARLGGAEEAAGTATCACAADKEDRHLPVANVESPAVVVAPTLVLYRLLRDPVPLRSIAEAVRADEQPRELRAEAGGATLFSPS